MLQILSYWILIMWEYFYDMTRCEYQLFIEYSHWSFRILEKYSKVRRCSSAVGVRGVDAYKFWTINKTGNVRIM